MLSLLRAVFLVAGLSMLPPHGNHTVDGFDHKSDEGTNGTRWDFQQSLQSIPNRKSPSDAVYRIKREYEDMNSATSFVASDRRESSDTLSLTKENLPPLLQEVAHYLQTSYLLLVTQPGDRDKCVLLARVLHRRLLPASCAVDLDMNTYHPVVVFIPSTQEGVEGVSAVMEDLARVAEEESRPRAAHVVLILPAHALVPRVEARMNFLIVQPKKDQVEFRERFSFGGEPPVVAADEVLGSWRHGGKSLNIPFRGDMVAPHDFRGNVVRCAVIESPPYVTLTRDVDGDINVEGFLVDVMRVLEQQLNFRIQWVVTQDGEYGIPFPNGTWSGLVGDLILQKADVAVSPLSITIPRSTVIDFSPPIDFSAVRSLVLRENHQQTLEWGTYYLTFHWSVWVSVVALWATMSSGLVFVSAPTEGVTRKDFLFSLAGAIAQQGCEVIPRCIRGRIVFISFWFGVLLIYVSYTARLTSQLAVVNTRLPFTSLEEAITSAGYRVATLKGTSYVSEMETAHDVGLRLAYQQLQENPSFLGDTMEEGIQLLHSGKKTLYFLDEATVNYVLHGSCNYTWIGREYFPEYVSLGYRKNLSFANVLSYYLSRAEDHGIIEKLKKKWWKEFSACDSGTTEFQELGMAKTVSAFVLLALGYGLSVIFLMCEVILSRYMRSVEFWDFSLLVCKIRGRKNILMK